MTEERVKKFLKTAILIGISLIIGSLITIFIKDNNHKILDSDPLEKRKEFKSLYEAYDAIMDDYYKDVDGSTLIDGALDGMLNSLKDKHSMYFDKESKDDFDAELEGTYYGIGAQIQLTNEGKIKIVKVFDDSPAAKAGLKEEDIILTIDGKSVYGLDVSSVASMLKSSKVEKSKIVVDRDSKEIEFLVTKSNVNLLSVSSEMLKYDNKNIGYISVSIFGQKTYSQFINALEKLEEKNINSLIIDLRGNSGGYLYTVTNMLELFIDKGKVLYQIQSNEGITKYKAVTKSKRDYNIVIIIDESSASASEIMAAAMKEQTSTVLVGKTTYGKGTVQTTLNLSNGSMIKYTIEKWLTPNGSNIDGEGIKPDYEVDLSEDYINNPIKENDNQLQKAIELLR